MTKFLFVVAVVVAAAQNPASFVCDIHYQTFVKTGSIYPNGRCYDVYRHSYPAHQVVLPCR